MRYQNMDLSGELMIVDREGNKTPFKLTNIECSPYQFPEVTGCLIGSVSKKKNGIKNVIFNNPATVVNWEDGTKTVVKCQPGDTYSEELGLAMCISKKFFGNKGNFNEVFKKWIPDDKDTDIEGMREALSDFCDETSCGSCVLHGTACRCGRGVHFKTGTYGRYDMSDNEIVEAYNKVFEKKEV